MLCWRIFGSKFLIVSAKLAQRKNIRVHLRCLIIKFVKHFMHSWQEQKSALEIFTRINAHKRKLGCLFWKPFRDYFHASKTLKGLILFPISALSLKSGRWAQLLPRNSSPGWGKRRSSLIITCNRCARLHFLCIRSLVEGLISGCSWISNFPHQPHQWNYCGGAERRRGPRCRSLQSQNTRHRRWELDNLDQWNIPGDNWFVTCVTLYNIIPGNSHKRDQVFELWDRH